MTKTKKTTKLNADSTEGRSYDRASRAHAAAEREGLSRENGDYTVHTRKQEGKDREYFWLRNQTLAAAMKEIAEAVTESPPAKAVTETQPEAPPPVENPPQRKERAPGAVKTKVPAWAEGRDQSSVESPTKRVWHIADDMVAANPNVARKEIVKACVESGIAYYTARTQVQLWRTAKLESEANALRVQKLGK